MGESEIISVSCPRCGSKQANKIEKTIAVCMGCGAKLEIRKKQSNQTANEKAESVVENNKVNVEQPKPTIAVEEKTNLIKEKKTMEESKYLKLARQARAEDNSEDAKLYYGKVREEEPENAEAKFFYAYYSLYDGKNIEITSKFFSLCKVVIPTVRIIHDSNMSKEEQFKTLEDIVNTFVPETWGIVNYMVTTDSKESKPELRIFSSDDYRSIGQNGSKELKALGDEIDKSYLDPAYKKLAVKAWKEYVVLSSKWYVKVPKGEAEIYAEKIKKYEPSYEMPKNTGCLASNHFSR